MLSHCQASDNVALRTRDDALANLRCISITAAENIIGQSSAPCGKFFWLCWKHARTLVAPVGTPTGTPTAPPPHCFLISLPQTTAVLVFFGLSCAARATL